MRPVLLRLMMVICLMLQIGCASLLPKGKTVTASPWSDYAEAKRSFDAITVGRTTVEELKQLGFDVKASPNIKILNYLDVASSVQPIPISELDPGLQACIRARSDCRAYIFEPARIDSKRIGNFWLDIFNFRRKTHQTGWRFKALIVFVNHTVAYKLSSGEPQVDTMDDKINPLGPIQAPVGILTHLVPTL
jgi:hypothetical protein